MLPAPARVNLVSSEPPPDGRPHDTNGGRGTMTAGMTTQKLDGRVSLPRAGLGALLAATLLAGGLIGAAAYAGIGVSTAQPAAVSMTLERESIVVRDLRIEAGRGQLVGESVAGPSTGAGSNHARLSGRTHVPGGGG